MLKSLARQDGRDAASHYAAHIAVSREAPAQRGRAHRARHRSTSGFDVPAARRATECGKHQSSSQLDCRVAIASGENATAIDVRAS